MSGNTSQIFSRVGSIQGCKLQAANTATDGTGTLDAAGTATTTTGHLGTLFTADATNGGRVDRIRFQAEGTCVTTVARIFKNNGSTNATATNNQLIAEVLLPATTASNLVPITGSLIELPSATDLNVLPIVLGPGEKLMVCLGTVVASVWDVTAFGGAY